MPSVESDSTLQEAPAAVGFRLSPQQQHLWRLGAAAGEPIYRGVCELRLEGPLDASALEHALETLAARHEILRTGFQEIPFSDQGLQVIFEEPRVALRRLDLAALDPAAREARLAAALAPLGTSLKGGEPLEALLVRLSDLEHRLLIALPVLSMDAEGFVSLAGEIAAAYAGEPPAGEPLQYADLAEWQNELLESEEMEEGRRFWRSQGLSDPLALRLPLERRSAPAGAFRPRSLRRTLPAAEAARLAALAESLEVPPAVLLMGCWRVLLARLSEGPEPVVAMAFGGRSMEGLAGALGPLTRFLPVRRPMEEGQSLAGLLRGLAEQVDALAGWQQYFSWPALLGSPGPAAEPYWPFGFEYLELPEPRTAAGVAFATETVEVCADRFKLKLSGVRSGQGLDLVLHYDAERFDPVYAGRLLDRLLVLLESALAAPRAEVASLEILGEAERREVLVDFNSTAAGAPLDRGLHELVAEQGARTPERLAVTFEGRGLTYAELDRRAGVLARVLREAGVVPGMRVAICAERSLEMVIGLLGILRTGAAYVPLDPEYPLERLELVRADAGAEVVLLQDGLASGLGRGAHVVPISAAWSEEEPAAPVAVDPDELAYVIYTSGSTGRPKGVMVSHRAILNRLLWMRDRLPLSEEDAVLFKTSFSFDASIWEIFVPLLSGARVVVARPGGQRDTAYLAETVVCEGVTVLQLVPSMLGPFLDDPGAAACMGLRRVFAGGEALPVELAARCQRLLPAGLFNLYGPTEAAIDATWWPCAEPGEGPLVPIGRPVDRMSVYVLDEDLRPVPVGTAGELCIAGPGLARGYLGRPDLTADSFVPDPFGEPGGRLYRTGDLARHRSDGAVEFLGRRDHQVKLRGFRIELGEIEEAIAGHPGVRQAVVTVREDAAGQSRLAGYAVPAPGADPSAAELQEALRRRLPAHMVPSTLTFLDELPRLPNGKIDRSALPEPERAAQPGGERGEAPRDAVEQLLATLWSDMLQVREVARQDDFFDLGGHSILATQLVSRIREVFGVELPLRELFGVPKLADQAARIETLRQAGSAPALPPLVRTDRQDRLPLSFAQQRLWVLERLEPGSAAYNLPSAVRLRGVLRPGLLERVLHEVARRHESLRTTFREVGGEPVQVIAPEPAVALPMIDLSALSPEEREAEAALLARREALRPFDLEAGPLLRTALLRLGAQDHVALLTLHHAVSDGWSSRVLIREIGALYGAFARGAASSLPELPLQYADFAAWQRQWLSGEVLAAQLAYWRSNLEGFSMALELPTDRPRPPAWSSRGARRPVAVAEPLREAVLHLARTEGVTPFMVLLAALGMVLQRWTGQDAVIVGTPIANRTRLEVEGLIGFFANTLALPVDLAGDPDFRGLLRRVREVSLSAAAHQDLPFEKLVEELQPARDLARSPLFQVMLTFENQSATALELEGLSLEPIAGEGGTAKFDLELLVWDAPGAGLRGFLEYATALFDPATVERMAGHFIRLLAGVAEDAGRPLSELPVLGDVESHQLLREWNDSGMDRPAATFLDLFDAQAVRTPDSVAARCGEESLSYAGLAARSERLARALAARGAGPGALVALVMPRGLDLLSAILAVFRTGAAYLPLDPQHPALRRSQVLEASGASLVVSGDDLAAFSGQEGNGLPAGPRPEDLAYAIFTSGSTGLPKGALLEHGGMLNHLLAKVEELGLTAEDRVAQNASQSFDISVWQFLAALLVGGRIEIFPDEVAHLPSRLAAEVERAGVSVLEMVPSLLRLLIEEVGRPGAARPSFARLRWMIPTGETLPPELCRAWFDLYPSVPLLNAYGPTECSDDVTHHRLAAAPPVDAVRVPVGRPVANLRLYVLDRWLREAPAGAAGHLHVGGAGVGRGYLGDPVRTAEVFLPDPWSEAPGGRLYRTGDLVRYRPGGEIEFLSRIDHQVKIRGFRVELEEIEAVLERHPAVRAAVVAVRNDGQGRPFLAAYLVLAGAPPSMADVRDFLRESLPEPMVPSAFKVVETLPLTPNGKVDRRLLPDPEGVETGREEEREAGSPVAELLAGLWTGLLGVEHAGPDDDFFALGGHSLLAMQLASRVRDAFGVEIALREVFEAPTVAALALRIERALRAGTEARMPPLVRVPREGDLPLSFAQQRLWFIDRLEPGSAAYNIFAGLRLAGPLEVPRLAGTIAALVARHESLRTSFHEQAGRPMQRIERELAPRVPVIDLSALPEPARAAEARRLALAEAGRPFDLRQAPLLRVTLLRLDPEAHDLLFTIHHIVSDAWSMDVLVRDTMALYGSSLTGAAPLPELAVQYADYAAWQRDWLGGPVWKELLGYWRRRLGGDLPVLALPTDRPRPPRPSLAGRTWSTALPPDLSREVEALGRRENATLFMVLLAALEALLYRSTGQEDIVVGTDVANRTRVETEPLIGFFVNHLVLRTDLAGNPTFRELLRRVRTSSLEAYAHQEMPFDRLVSELRPERTLGVTPLFQLLFVLQNAPSRPIQLPGLALEPLRVDEPRAKYDLTLFVERRAEGLVATWRYRTDLFDEPTIQGFAQKFTTLIASAVAEPETRLSQLEILNAAEKRERTMEKQKLQTSSLDKLKNLKPKVVSLPQGDLIRAEPLNPGELLPLLVQPAVDDLDLPDWGRSNRQLIEEKLRQHGALLFRGFAVPSVSVFERFAGTLCPQLFGEYGDLPREENSDKVYHSTPYPPDKPILFHNESSHLHQWPMKQFFHCVIPARERGETPIVDCRKVHQRLDPRIVERFRDKKLMYVRNFIEGFDVAWQDFFRTDDRAKVEAYCRQSGMEFEWKGNNLMTRRISPGVCRHPRTGEWTFFNQVQLHHISCLDSQVRESMLALFDKDDLPRNVYYGDGTPIEDSVMAEIDEVYWSTSVAFPWQAGDIIVLDNMITAHARNPYVGPRKIVVAMGEMISADEVYS